MKPEELMLGDIVLASGKPIHVTLATLSCKVDVKPMPLTEEILENSGFERVSLDSGKICGWRDEEDSERGYYVIDITYGSKCRLYVEVHGSATVEKYCDYVHEFQHLLKLCGIEKEIIV